MASEEAAAAQAASATAQTVDGFGPPVTPMPTAGVNADAANSLAPSRPAAALAVNETSQARPLERTARASEPGERAPPHEDTPSNAALPPTRPRPRSHTSIAAISRKQERSRARQSEPGMERSDPGNHHMRAGIRGRDQSHPRSRFSVVRTDNKPRTQNGHIRNDTRDVLRRISGVSNGAICRRKCVASDRACTRVTLRNLHGKEGVDGSSPSEGSAETPCSSGFCPPGRQARRGGSAIWVTAGSLLRLGDVVGLLRMVHDGDVEPRPCVVEIFVPTRRRGGAEGDSPGPRRSACTPKRGRASKKSWPCTTCARD